MMNRNRLFFFLCVFPFFTSFSLAQVPNNNLQLGFRQDFNNYLWKAAVHYIKAKEHSYQIVFQEDFNSNLLYVPALSPKWRDENRFTFSYKNNLLPWFSNIALLKAFSLSDKQSGYHNSAHSEFVALGFQLELQQLLNWKGLVGPKWDSRFNHDDQGVGLQVELLTDDLQWQGYYNRWQLRWSHDRIGRRQEHDFSLSCQFQREFYEGTSDSLVVTLNRLRRDYYITKAGDLETRSEKKWQVNNWLSYRIFPGLDFHLFSSLYVKKSDIEQIIQTKSTGRRERQDDGLRLKTQLDYRRNSLQTILGFLYHAQVQEYKFLGEITPSPFMGSIGIPDNQSKLFQLYSNLRWWPTSKDSLALHGSISCFRYDTPDTNNFDDRDELRINLCLTNRYRFHPDLALTVGAYVNLNHLIYIYAEHSADNNWSRIFRLSTNLTYQPNSNILWKQSAEVLAKYTDYDFEEILSSVRSFVFREFTLCNTVQVKLFANTKISFFYRLELEENGRLFWESFSEQLLERRQNNFFSWSTEYLLFDQFRLTLGVSGYFRQQWYYQTTTLGETIEKKQGRFCSYGPLFRIQLLNQTKQQAYVSLSMLRVKDSMDRLYYIHHIDLSLNWGI